MTDQEWTAEDVQAVLVNPFYAVTISPTLFGEHDPIIARSRWVQANARLIEQIGAEAWLNRLLDVLESGAVATEDSPPPDAPPALPKNRQERRLQQLRRTRSGDAQ